MIGGIIIGIFLMSFFTLCSIISIKSNNEKLAVIFGGPIVWITILIGGPMSGSTINESKKFHSLLLCPDGKVRHIANTRADVMVSCDKDYHLAKFETLGESPKDWKKRHRLKVDGVIIGDVRYAPQKVWVSYDPIPAKEYKYALRNQKRKQSA